MLAITLASAYLIVLALAAATAKGARSPIAMTERGSAALLFLERNHRAGTKASRAKLERVSKARIWGGLWLARVAWRDRRSGDIDGDSPFGCIHFHEATWRDSGDPHWGGLQMDSGFYHTYGREFVSLWGTPDRWPIWAQIVAAYRAYHGYHGYRARHYGPWSTAPRCGL